MDDLNSTGHIAVAGVPSTRKVNGFGKEAPHIHKECSKMRRHLYAHGHPRVAEKNNGSLETRKAMDQNQMISREIVNVAVRQRCGGRGLNIRPLVLHLAVVGMWGPLAPEALAMARDHVRRFMKSVR